jgi:ubiquinone/menaquinone biosynthesis C-methylase UbiE
MNRYFGVHVLDGEWHALLPRYLVLTGHLDGARVLDIGCGTGIGSSMMLEMGADHVDGVDYRPEVLDLAEMKHAKDELTFHTMLWENLDFEDDTFDVVVCMDPSTPVTDPTLLEEVRRVLRSDGEYVCAIERSNVGDLSDILPRYGYSSPGRNVEVARGQQDAPQVRELSNYFEDLTRLSQQPRMSWVFESDTDETPTDDEESGFRPEDVVSPTVDRTFCTDESEAAGVELVFCGSESSEPPNPRDVRLPYHQLVERLGTIIRDLQFDPRASDEELDEETDVEADDEGADDADLELDEEVGDDAISQRLGHVANAYERLRHAVHSMREQTQATLIEQERLLGQMFQHLQTEVPAEAGESSTDVFERSTASHIEEFEDLGPDSSQEALEDELARMKRERSRLNNKLDANAHQIDQLEGWLDESD